MSVAEHPAPDRFAVARSVADAVLYEGYVLYPYRASARKNQVRFQWGVLVPKAFSEADGSERWSTRTECLLDRCGLRPDQPGAGLGPVVLRVRVRCLQMQRRSVEALVRGTAAEPSFVRVDGLEVDGVAHVPWDEALDQSVDLPPLLLGSSDPVTVQEAFTFGGGAETEPLATAADSLVGRLVRERLPVDGVVRVVAAPTTDSDRFVRVSVTVENTTEWGPAKASSSLREEAMARSLVAVHTMLAVDGARFVSLLDPLNEAADAAAECRSDGSYPVLVGDEQVILSSPIILYDHPEVAPQSPGDLYDALEIDEILALRVMTLTDEEKAEARGTDPRSAAIIERCDGLSPESMSRLHGQMRPVAPDPDWVTLTTPSEGGVGVGSPDADPTLLATSPWWDAASDASVDPWTDTVQVDGVELGQGSPVRLHPSGRADAQDMFLDGRRATVAGVFADVDGGWHLAVTLDDDPAVGELEWQGRYLYFHTHEVEPIRQGEQGEQGERGELAEQGTLFGGSGPGRADR
jgi:hypothetical protein